MRMLFLLVAGVSLACGSQEPAKEPESLVKNAPKEELSELEIARPILLKLYPELGFQSVSELGGVMPREKVKDAREAKGLIKKIKELGPGKTWALIEVPAGGDLRQGVQRYQEVLPELSIHTGNASNAMLVLGSRDDVDLARALARDMAKLRKQVVFKYISAAAARERLKAKFPNVEIRDGDEKDSLLVTYFRSQKNAIDEFLSQIDLLPVKSVTISLRNRQVVEAAKMIKRLYPGVAVTTDSTANQLYLLVDDRQHQQIQKLVKAFDGNHERSVEDANARGSREELQRAVRAEFESRQKLQLVQIQALKQRLQLLEQRLSNHKKFKDQMIRKRVDALLADPSLSSRKASAVKPETDTSRLAQLEPHTVQPGDTLGLFIENIWGASGSTPPIHTDPTGVRPPAMGYPMMVRPDGTLSLPILGSVKISGLSLKGVESKLMHEYAKREVLREGRDLVMVSWIRRAGDVAAPRRLLPAETALSLIHI